ncbi:hypothetical protein T03_9194 [Trichinella britovi]|uniref:Uncharacterized protein n=1 Tax=Trichinella britovi TaxID=45882 RepID=A0A0V1CYJ3_TRIBR|nr:hypothetical protein T03_9194 [Trichinella britovi]
MRREITIATLSIHAISIPVPPSPIIPPPNVLMSIRIQTVWYNIKDQAGFGKHKYPVKNPAVPPEAFMILFIRRHQHG